jgi:transcription initiation factor TFIID subunit 8
MRNFTSQVRKSMSSARRTETTPHDWVYALASVGLSGSSCLEPHLDTGDVPPEILQPTFAPPEPTEPPLPDLEGMLGPELSGKADKEARKYIPAHFPPFPPKHAWMSTPVFTKRENDPRKIREKATEEGILAEQSLRKLMAAQKAGIQGNKARKQRRSKRMKDSDKLWKEAMTELLHEEAEREEKTRLRNADEDADGEFEDETVSSIPRPAPQRKVNLDEGVHVNYDQKFFRQSARGS